mmetsp:Transcript_6226/g.7141  ORF Transcript_6226/g.7141 Transcript_6226/m.7141 type:complete len:413 (+) Transcript_6226:309-1547(+)
MEEDDPSEVAVVLGEGHIAQAVKTAMNNALPGVSGDIMGEYVQESVMAEILESGPPEDETEARERFVGVLCEMENVDENDIRSSHRASSTSSSCIRPPALQLGDTIALIAPASWGDGFQETAEALQQRGYKVKLPSNQNARYGYLAGTDKHRAEAVMDAWRDPTVKVIWCLRGGYGCGRMLEYLDYEYIQKDPKVLVGMSDITALHAAIMQRTGLVTFLGPVAKWTFDPKRDTNTMQQGIWDCICKGQAGRVFNGGQGSATLVGGTAEGFLVGGNLSLICAHIGTEWELDTHEKILILEDVGEKVYRIDRMLNQLQQAGKLGCLRGAILASWAGCEGDEVDGWDVEHVCREYFEDAEYPVVFGFPSGHVDQQLTLALNCRYLMDGDARQLTLLQSAVAPGESSVAQAWDLEV